ncbi:S-layer homology domain-containing protein [cf. Phormidesmis sp. LEGE 11477]|nr:S-layer homology domain-containing protein [cf. Phormidesmis sp. LEGE 11477]
MASTARLKNSVLPFLPLGLAAGLLLNAIAPAKADFNEAGMRLAKTEDVGAIASSQPATNTKQSNSFSDVGADYWAQPFIGGLAVGDYISGYDNGQFRPNQPLTRAEFAAMLTKAFADAPAVRSTAITFTDISNVAWAVPAISFVESRGFMSGVGQGRFDPSSNISRIQVITALSSGLGLDPIDDTEMFLATNYTDMRQIPFWAYSPATAATMNDIVVNTAPVTMPTRLEPNRAATRGEVAAMVYQALVKQDEIAPINAASPATTHIVGF